LNILVKLIDQGNTLNWWLFFGIIHLEMHFEGTVLPKTRWTIVDFVKFAGKLLTLPQIILTDPDWFWYLIEKEGFRGRLAREAADIAQKVRRIRTSSQNRRRWKVRYHFTREGSFLSFDVFDTQIVTAYTGSASTLVSDFIDLSIVRPAKSYDKNGNRRLIKCLKYHLYKRTMCG